MTPRERAEKILKYLGNGEDWSSRIQFEEVAAQIEEAEKEAVHHRLASAVLQAYNKGFNASKEQAAEIADKGSTTDHGDCDRICGCKCTEEIAQEIRSISLEGKSIKEK